MAGCDGMDLEQPGLCQAHAQTGNQSIDKPQAPDTPPFVTVGFAIVTPDQSEAAIFPAKWADRELLTRSTAPPIAIRNCCFRI